MRSKICSESLCHTGHVIVDNVNDAGLFYLLARSSSTKYRKLIVFLNGGPGTSSMDGLVFGYGPFRVTSAGDQVPNEYWLSEVDFLFVDQPAGVGFSYNSGSADRANSLLDVAREFVIFMRGFYRHFPEFRTFELYFAGESFAGTYIPYIARELMASPVMQHQNISGIFLANPWIDPKRQYLSFIDFIRSRGLLPSDRMPRSREQHEKCRKILDDGPVRHTIQECDEIAFILNDEWKSFHKSNTYFNAYSVSLTDPKRGMSWPPSMSAVTKYFNDPTVQSQLNTIPGSVWSEGNDAIFSVFKQDASEPSIALLPDLSKHVPIFIIAGDDDLISNIIGFEWMLGNLTRDYKPQVDTKTKRRWTVGGKDVGYMVGGNGIEFRSVSGGSHMLGEDKPLVLMAALRVFLGMSVNDNLASSISPGSSTKSTEYRLLPMILVMMLFVVIGIFTKAIRRQQGQHTRIPASVDSEQQDNIPLVVFELDNSSTTGTFSDEEGSPVRRVRIKEEQEEDT
eukprot:Partr_v1_DN26812_c2_g1_i4_m40436 putative Protease with a carboxypeptidase B-like function involved in the C-terminal processing of the lysine and arginine residues from protein precursors. Promotes cell fusion and is involved in the programmed cell death (By similarity)